MSDVVISSLNSLQFLDGLAHVFQKKMPFTVLVSIDNVSQVRCSLTLGDKLLPRSFTTVPFTGLTVWKDSSCVYTLGDTQVVMSLQHEDAALTEWFNLVAGALFLGGASEAEIYLLASSGDFSLVSQRVRDYGGKAIFDGIENQFSFRLAPGMTARIDRCVDYNGPILCKVWVVVHDVQGICTALGKQGTIFLGQHKHTFSFNTSIGTVLCSLCSSAFFPDRYTSLP